MNIRTALGVGLIAVALIPSGCGSSDGEAEEPRFSAQEERWAEAQCVVEEQLDEYQNPEGWDRCVADYLPRAADGIEEDELSEAVRADAVEDPRCEPFVVVRHCIEALNLWPGVPEGDGRDAPDCSSIWKIDAELPAGYSGCVRDGRYFPNTGEPCDGGSLLFIYSDPENSYYAFVEEDYPSIIGDAAEVGTASEEIVAATARDVCDGLS